MTLVVDTGSWTTKVGLASSEASVNVPTSYANEDHPPSATDPTSKLYIDFFNSISNQEDQGGAQKDSAGEQKENTSWMQNTQSIFLTESRDFSSSKSPKASVIDEIFKLFPLVQQISFGASPYCSLISTGRAEHGLVIDSGYFQTTVTSIFCGNIVRGGEQTDNSSGGWHVTKALSDFTGLSRKECESSIIFHPSPPMLYSPQMQPPSGFVLPDGTILDQGGEAIHATMMSMVAGMCTASSKAIDSCDPFAKNIVKDLRKNMLLVGGNTLGNDFTDAFEQRFHKQADSKHHVNCDFISSKFRANSQWKGAVIMAEMNEEWITREKVEEFGLENVVDVHAKKNMAAPWV